VLVVLPLPELPEPQATEIISRDRQASPSIIFREVRIEIPLSNGI
jgi:hypothetical protein